MCLYENLLARSARSLTLGKSEYFKFDRISCLYNPLLEYFNRQILTVYFYTINILYALRNTLKETFVLLKYRKFLARSARSQT